jgi:hypothetical protein
MEHLRDGLWEHYLLDEEVEARCADYTALLTTLEKGARSILATGGPAGTTASLANWSDLFTSLIDFMPASGDGGFAGPHARLAFSAEAYRDYVSGSSLQVAGGDPDIMYILVDIADSTVVYAGPVYSYYEFSRESGETMDSSDWWELLDRTPAPERPLWVLDFLVE